MRQISLFFVGDLVCRKKQGPSISSRLLSLIRNADAAILNFEAPIHTEEPPIRKSGPNLSQPKEMAKWVENIGFKYVLCANNHLMDYGAEALKSTLNSFSLAETVGAGLTATEAYAVKYLSKNGITVGLISLCQYEFGIVESYQKEKPGVAWVLDPSVRDVISDAKAKADAVIVCPHAGLENVDYPLPEWQDCYRNLIDWGADAVIGGHTHTPQGYEWWKGKPILYSLGNFYFDGSKSSMRWNTSLGASVVINEQREIYLAITPLRFTENEIDVCQNKEVLSHIAKLNEMLVNREKLENWANKESRSLWELYRYQVLRGTLGFSFRDLSLRSFIRLFGICILKHQKPEDFLNIMRCETHRWVVQRAITQ